MKIGDIDLAERRILVAEIGNNHEGDAAVALKMVDAAADAGADAVKVQVINPLRLVNKSEVDRIRQLTKFQLPIAVFSEMAARAVNRGMLFMASAFDVQSLESVLGFVAAVKIASGDLDFEPLLATAAESGKPVLLSTGMASLGEIRNSVEFIGRHMPAGTLPERLALLHCVSLYPAPLAAANLRAIRTLANEFGLTAGYSDHTLGIESSIASLAMGARVVEKHFTLDKSRTTFRDHALSADAADLRRLADAVHAFDDMLGTGEKAPSEGERQMAAVARRSLVAARDLPAGTLLAGPDIEYLRPRNGLPPSAASRLIGKTLRVALKMHDRILEEHLT